jgi:hypothetical protein
MPVAKGPELKIGRAVVAGLVAVAIGVVLIVVVTRLANSGDVEVRLGDDEFNAGLASAIASTVDDGGPILYPDVAGGTRDILLNHLGDDVRRGWVAFEAHRPGSPRECVLVWDPETQWFSDPCAEGVEIPADGGDLTVYVARVDEDGNIIVNLKG